MYWNYKHNTTLPNTTVVNAPTSYLRGNVCYIDVVNGFANQAAVTAVNSSAQIGSADYPYDTFSHYKSDIGTHGIYLSIFAKGEYLENGLGSLSSYSLFSDRLWAAKFKGNESTTLCSTVSRMDGFFISGYTGTATRCNNCIIANPCTAPVGAYNGDYGNIYTANVDISWNSAAVNVRGCYFFNNIVLIGDISYSIFNNVTITSPLISYLNKATNVFWNGSITVGASTYDISAAIAALKSEATIKSEIGTLFGVTFVGRILNPHPINISKGNFNFDYIGNEADIDAIIAAQTAFPNIVKKGLKLEWNSIEASSDFIFSASSPHYSNSDGFNGLVCNNLNSDGTIINSAVDTVAVSKKFTLSTIKVIDFIHQFGQIGLGLFNFDELYIRAVLSGNIEDVFSITNGYTCSYNAGIFSSSLPRFYLNLNAKCNKVGDTALGKIDLGLFNVNESRNQYKVSALKFQLIFVKRRV